MLKPRFLLIVAVALAGLLAAGCGGGSDSTASTSLATTTTAGAEGETTTAPADSTTTTAPAQIDCADIGSLPAGGTDDLKLSSGGLERVYRRFVPSNYDPAKPTPLVVSFHGLTSPIAGQVLISDFEAKAEQVGAIVLTPLGSGPGPSWNVANLQALPGQVEGGDDIAFVKDLIEQTKSEACVDPQRVFAIGMSNGAQMSSLVACEMSDEIAAVAPVAGLLAVRDCEPQRPIPLISFHGTADQYLNFDGGIGPEAEKLLKGLGGTEQINQVLKSLDLLAIPEAEDYWAKVDGCSGDAVDSEVTEHVSLRAYDDCKQGSQVELYVVDGGGHAWPGSPGSAAVASVVGLTTTEISANDLIWEFFEKHPLQQ